MAEIDPLEISEVADWLDQFDTIDRYVAISLLRSLYYVSFAEFEEFLQKSLNGLRKHCGEKNKLGLFPIRREVENQFNKHKEKKYASDSAGRIAHALLNLERQLAPTIEVNPRKKSLADSKVRNLIFIDDFIGSGNRVIDFWKRSVDPSIKSWVSQGLCRVWIIAYAAHAKGINKIVRNIGCLTPDSFIIELSIDDSPLLLNDNIKQLLTNYSVRTKKGGNIPFGYGGNATPVVFQHGCPNNMPVILWSSGRPNIKGTIASQHNRWNALFPERGIPSALYPLFESDLKFHELPELLWSSGQYRLALSFLEKIDYPKKNPQTFITLTVLALLSSGKRPDNIKAIMMMSDDDFDDQINKLINFQLCDDEGYVTSFGKDILERNKKTLKEKLIDDKYEVFYPSTFMGTRREI